MKDPPEAQPERRQRGRPRRWGSDAEKYREYRAQKAALHAAVGELLHAVRNARLDDPGLQASARDDDEVTLVKALTAYYRERHWQKPVRESGAPE